MNQVVALNWYFFIFYMRTGESVEKQVGITRRNDERRCNIWDIGDDRRWGLVRREFSARK